MNYTTRYVLQVSSGILTFVSIVFTVLLWSQLPTEWWMKGIAGLAGFALELCKFSLLPLSFLMLKNRETTGGLALLLLGSLLFAVSIGASVAFLENGEQQRQQQSLAWQQRQTSIAQLDEQIKIGQQSASRTLRADTLNQVEQWQSERKELLSQPVENSSMMLGIDQQQRLSAWLLLAILIDGCAIAGWVLLSRKEHHQEEKTFSTTSEQQQKRLQNIKPEPELLPEQVTEAIKEPEIEPETEASQSTLFDNVSEHELIIIEPEIRDRIVHGEHGERFSIRGFMEKEKIGHKKAKPILNSLVQEGVLISLERGYQLTGATGELI